MKFESEWLDLSDSLSSAKMSTWMTDIRQRHIPKERRYEIMMMDKANLAYAQEILIKLRALEETKARQIKENNASKAI